ncbi:MAG: iron(III) transport system substrate-binding protein [Actinomycetota bacterium]|nr:iron(III) transport system substrate-binding protein [Actinomycetota bacterium]
MRKTTALGTGVLGVILLALPSCSTADPQVRTSVAASGSAVSGKINIACGAQEDWCQAMTKAFETRTGVRTTFVRLSSGEALARLGAVGKNTEFDVWHGGPSDGYIAADKSGLLERYTPKDSAAIDARYKDPNGAWTGVYVGVLGFCSNRKVLAAKNITPPDSWEDLVDPKLRGLVAVAHPATSGTAYTALWTQVKLRSGEDNALAYFRKLHPNVLQYSKSGSAPAQQAGRGEIATGVVFTHDCVKNQEEGLTDLVVTVPNEGTGYEIGGVAMVKGTRNTPAAQAYLDFAVSAEAQNLAAGVKAYQLPTNPKATVSSKSIKISDVKLVDYDAAAAGDAKRKLVGRFETDVAGAPKG